MISLFEPGLQVADIDSGLRTHVRGVVWMSEMYVNLYTGFAGDLDLYTCMTGNLQVPTGLRNVM
jgi:hypothetical protein